MLLMAWILIPAHKSEFFVTATFFRMRDEHFALFSVGKW